MHSQGKPLLSIVIPVYNTERYVEKCLDSIFAQTYKNIEVIIVNNGSSGNINEIVKNYREYYPDRTIKLVINEKNLGTFHGRGSGMSSASGDYYTFFDADDRVGIDFYAKMIKKAEETGAEIVVADLVHEDENGNQFRYVVDPVRSLDFDLEGPEKAFDFYYGFQGLSYSMYGIWNKIYKRELWERCQPYIQAVDEQFALCEDAVYTTIFFSMTKKAVNLHNEYYYHFVHSNSESGSLVASVEKAKRSTVFQATAFRQMQQHLERTGLYEKYRKNFEVFRNFHLKVMLFHIQNSKFSIIERQNLAKFCKRQFGVEDVDSLSNDDMFFTQYFVEQTNNLEELKTKIADHKTKIVCFDIFDVALVRNLWNPSDLFELMKDYCRALNGRNVDFPKMRVAAERYAREQLYGNQYEEVTFDEIYEALQVLYALPADVIEKLKKKEFEFEKKISRARETVQALYGLVIRCGKKILFASDTYFSNEQAEELLRHSGYGRWDGVYVSSEFREKKETGNLYREIIRHYSSGHKTDILYIGKKPREEVTDKLKGKMTFAPFPKAADVFCNYTDFTYAGELFAALFGNYVEINRDLRLRTLLSMVANRIFDNPYVKFNGQSDFNGDPYYMGYFAGGFYISAICNWLIRRLEEDGCKAITFLGNDSLTFKKVFDSIVSFRKIGIISKLEDIAIKDDGMPFPHVWDKNGLLELNTQIDIAKYSAEEIISNLESVLSDEFLNNRADICIQAGIVYHRNFTSYTTFHKLTELLANYFDSQKASAFRKCFACDSGVVFVTSFSENAVHYAESLGESVKVFSIFDCSSTKILRENHFERRYENAKQRILFSAFLNPSDTESIGTKCIHSIFNKGVLDFETDCLKAYGDLLDFANYDSENMEKPIQYLLNSAKPLDRFLLDTLKIDKTEYTGRQVWDSNVSENLANQAALVRNSGAFISYDYLGKLQKFVYLMFFDRKKMKDKFKDKFKKHKIFITICRDFYKSIVGIKNLLKHE